MIDGVAVGAQHAHEIGDQAEGVVEGGEVGDLRADVNIDSRDLDSGQLGRLRINFAGRG